MKRLRFATLCVFAFFGLVTFWELGYSLGRDPRLRDAWATNNMPAIWLASAITFSLIGWTGLRSIKSNLTGYMSVWITVLAVFIATTWIERMTQPDEDFEMLIFVVSLFYFLPSSIAASIGFFVGTRLAKGKTSIAQD
jgi:hypothetical protein